MLHIRDRLRIIFKLDAKSPPGNCEICWYGGLQGLTRHFIFVIVRHDVCYGNPLAQKAITIWVTSVQFLAENE